MSFATSVKDDLARIVSQKRCCRQAEFAACLRLAGNINIGRSQAISLTVTTQHAAAARKIFTICKDLFALETEMIIHRKNRLKKNQVYSIHILPQKGINKILELVGVMNENDIWRVDFPGPLNPKLLQKDCCKRAYLRGAFLVAGSINDPGSEYHLEIICNDLKQAFLIRDLMMEFSIKGKITRRKHHYIIYLKESDQIVDLLNVMGSYRSLLEFENTRIVKSMRNQVNRVVNCETANLNKTIQAGLKQAEDIKLIADNIGLDKLPYQLREVAQLRLSNPERSLSELSELMCLGRSCINHRLRRLSEIADNIRDFGTENWRNK
ncbi:MAG: DNA-binding protein WhiA [Bacillota bacterium]|jgi:DNA-binding protein WhiA